MHKGCYDTLYMDKIRLRHALNLAQAYLARLAGLGDSHLVSELSRAWRLAFDAEVSDKERVGKAKKLLAEHALNELLGDAELLTLLVEKRSVLRIDGDAVAHPATTSAEVFLMAINRLYPGLTNAALNKLVLYTMKFK